jgi:hypothetical protein
MDRESDSQQLADLFRVDLVLPIGEEENIKAFRLRFPHLIKPFWGDGIYTEGDHSDKRAQVLDVINAMVHLRDKPTWKAMKERKMRVYKWRADDPLADAFLVQLGAFPTVEETGVDYEAALIAESGATEQELPHGATIPAEVLEHPGINSLAQLGLGRHYSIQNEFDHPGFFFGDASNLDDLLSFWNLRAADIPLWFVDSQHLTRYEQTIPAWEKIVRERLPRQRSFGPQLTVWTRESDLDKACQPFASMAPSRCFISPPLWNGRNIRVPLMYLGETSVLGVVGGDATIPKVSFALTDKPFCADTWFYHQLLVASISFIGGLYNDEQHTLTPPFIPELNEFYARSMVFHYDRLRIEPRRLGIIIKATEHDTNLMALSVAALVERIFGLAGYATRLSSSGLIASVRNYGAPIAVWIHGLQWMC